VRVTRFAGNLAWGKLEVDLGYFGFRRTPLARITSHDNLAASMVELARFGGYLARLMLSIHAWSFRKPDPPRAREPQRLPAEIKRSWVYRLLGLAPPPPQIHELRVGTTPLGEAVHVRLTRYANLSSRHAPVAMIHGYSASGTTFAHTALRPGLAEWLWRKGRDVWVIDLRSSSGMPTATLPWSFEDVALADIPAAIDFIQRQTQKQVDVVAHCLGVVMLSMAVLKPPEAGDPFFRQRASLHLALRRVVLSQVGPRLQFTPINRLRAHVMRYVRHYFGVGRYDFRVKDSPSATEELTDRVLATLRYPWRERLLEAAAPMRNDFTGTRRRMDILYGRAFSLENMSREVLAHIDDFFGPLNLETLSQTIHMAKFASVTDRAGRNVYLNRRNRDERWIFPTLFFRGHENGIMSSNTMSLMDGYFNRHDVTAEKLPLQRVGLRSIQHMGHQDCLIGRWDAVWPVFDEIRAFLDAPDDDVGRRRLEEQRKKPTYLVAQPYIGPLIGVPDRDGNVTVAMATHPVMGKAVFAIAVPVLKLREPGKVREYFKPVAVTAGFRSDGFLWAVECDKDNWFSVKLPAALHRCEADGLMFFVIFEESRSLLPPEIDAERDRFRAKLQSLHDAHVPVPAEVWTIGAPQLAAAAEFLDDRVMDALRGLGDYAPQARKAAGVRWQIVRRLERSRISELSKSFLPCARHWDTALENAPEEARLFLASCQYPAGLLDEWPALESYRRLEACLDPRPARHELLVLTGDQIYSDATAGLFDPSSADERYVAPHQALFLHPPVRRVMGRIPSVMMLDDHELGDNWEPGEEQRSPRDEIRDGVLAYKRFQRRTGPALLAPTADAPEPLWFSLEVGGAAVFVADTRTERRARSNRDPQSAQIMSARQMRELLRWLERQDPEAPKFIVSPAIMFPRRLSARRRAVVGEGPRVSRTPASALKTDAWSGFPRSMASLLHFIARRRLRHVIFLSGDEHVPCVARAELTLRAPGARGREVVVVHSIHGPPLYAPFVFANSRETDFATNESFVLPAGRGALLRCKVMASFETGDGFAEILVSRGPPHRVKVRFHGASGSVSDWYPIGDERASVRAGDTLAMSNDRKR
jgi:hypothetical protein